MSSPTQRTKQDDLQAVVDDQVRHEALSFDGRIGEKLDRLQAFLRQMEQSAAGKLELQRRTRQFGACVPRAGESHREFYGRLRQWIDRDLSASS